MSLKHIRVSALLVLASTLAAQVYSPKLLRKGQPDSTDLRKFAEAIYVQANANTSHEKAEAIWRFFLTDGRFVKPGFWYHIAGWTYEEPSGEVLDPIKLLNSYGFGLCYHIAPLLEAVFEAGGFKNARCWFLTGHTVTEVFYDGAYHYFDSDMMGYNVAGEGPFKGKAVVSVQDLERDSHIILGKLAAPDKIKPNTVDYPWYPADVRARAMGDLAALFTTTGDNYLYPYTRFSSGHTMDFVLRPGEKLIRYFGPEEPGLFYLPYKNDGNRWTEFPQEIAEYQIRTADGPHSQKDTRRWATGRIEYSPPPISSKATTIIDMPSPYVIIDARFSMLADLPSSHSVLRVETSTNGGKTWILAGELKGTHKGEWQVEPATLARSAHGRLTAVSGFYGYKVRITKSESSQVQIQSLRLVSRIQLNPRTVPPVEPGENQFVYSSAPPVKRVAVPTEIAQLSVHSFDRIQQKGQTFLLPSKGKTGDILYVLEADQSLLTGFDVGVRFLNLQDGLAPDKLTAEVRHSGVNTNAGEASIEWSCSSDGPFRSLWRQLNPPTWLDGKPVTRLLVWPEVFQHVPNLPAGTKRVYVKLRSSGPAIDNIRLAAYARSQPSTGHLRITQTWLEHGIRHQHTEEVDAAVQHRDFGFPAGLDVKNEAVTLSAE